MFASKRVMKQKTILEKFNSAQYWDDVYLSEFEKLQFKKREYPERDDFVIHCVGIISHEKNFSIVDLGCGFGIFLSKIAKKFPFAKLLGVDQSCIAVRNSLVSTYLLREDIIQYLKNQNDKKSKVDFCVLLDVLEHFENPDDILVNLRQFAKTVIISVPDSVLSPVIESEHACAYTVSTLRKLVGAHFDYIKTFRVPDRWVPAIVIVGSNAELGSFLEEDIENSEWDDKSYLKRLRAVRLLKNTLPSIPLPRLFSYFDYHLFKVSPARRYRNDK